MTLILPTNENKVKKLKKKVEEKSETVESFPRTKFYAICKEESVESERNFELTASPLGPLSPPVSWYVLV